MYVLFENGWSAGDQEGLERCFEAAFDMFTTKFYILGFYVSAMSLAFSIIILCIVLTILRGMSK